MAEPIKVLLTDDTGTATITTGNVAQNNPNKPINESAKANKKASMLSTVSHLVAMRAVSYTTSNIGKWTGNTRAQNVINGAKTAVGYGIAFAVNPLLGAVTVGLDGVTTVLDYAYENKWQNIRSAQAQARAGGKGGYRRWITY